jgi:predicted metal-dependent hydrolase
MHKIQPIKIDNKIYNYTLIAQKRKTISLSIYPDKRIFLKYPFGCDLAKIYDFVVQKTEWIKKRLVSIDLFNFNFKVQTYLSGSEFIYLGKKFSFEIVESKVDNILVKGDIIEISTKKSVQDQIHNQKILQKWLKINANQVFLSRYKFLCEQFILPNQSIPELKIKNFKRRWGSYSKKPTLNQHMVTLNFKLIYKDLDCLDYVIIHEICHITHFDHSKNFYKLLSQRLPNWKSIKIRLEKRA